MSGGGTNQVLWNPHVGLERKSIGLGVGLVTPSGNRRLDDIDITPASGHLRIGNPRGTNVSFHLMEDEPVYSGGGTFVTRFSMPVGSRLRPWVGVGAADPFDRAAFLAGSEVQISPGLSMNVGGRLGSSEGLSENSIRAGLSYAWTHARYGYRPMAHLPAPSDSAAGR